MKDEFRFNAFFLLKKIKVFREAHYKKNEKLSDVSSCFCLQDTQTGTFNFISPEAVQDLSGGSRGDEVSQF